MKTTDAWPYPRWVAHRGAGKLAPENTLAAFQLGATQGYRMFECDVKLSSDGVPLPAVKSQGALRPVCGASGCTPWCRTDVKTLGGSEIRSSTSADSGFRR